MRKIKIISLLFSLVITTNLFAQSVDDGRKFLYYERYNSAKDVLGKLVTANPNNVDAAYWLGQTLIAMEDTAGAKALYQKTLQANSNAPLIMVGAGEIELMENKTNDARNRFETAISLTKAKDANILSAIGRANVNAKAGDAVYAIDKLKQAADKDKKSAQILANLGDAYRKMTDGTNATLSYQNALAIDPNYAKASFMIGRIYQTQGYSQEPYYMQHYNDAMTKDPKYAPVYYWLYDYYYRRDVNKSADYLNKFIAVADNDNKNCYYQAAILYASKKYQESISKSDECIAAGGTTPFANLYGLKAFAYDKMGDSINAKTFFESYFQKQNPEKLGPGDYATYAKVLLKFPGNESVAGGYADKAVALDTLEENKIDYITAIANSYLAQKNYNEAGKWYAKLLTVKKNPGKVDLYNAGYNYYKGSNYKAADSIFLLYSQKFPEDILAPYMMALSEAYIDSSGALGLAKPTYEKVIQMATAPTADTAKVKSQLKAAYRYMVAYYYSKNDFANAIINNDKILAIDPTDATAITNRTALAAALTHPVKVKTKGDETKIKNDSSKTKITTNKTKVKPK